MKRWYQFLLIITFISSCASPEKKAERALELETAKRDSVEMANFNRFNEVLLASTEDIRMIIESRMSGDRYRVMGNPLYSSVLLPSLYIRNEFKPLWITHPTSLDKARQMIKYIEDAEFHGLNPAHYHLEEIQNLWETLVVDSTLVFDNFFISNLDMLLSDAFFMLSSHLYYGKVEQETLEAKWAIRRNKPDLALDQSLLKILSSESIDQGFQMFYPPFTGYKAMVSEARRLKQFLQKDFQVDVGATFTALKPGDSSAIMPIIKTKLAFLGLYESDSLQDESLYDETAVNSIMELQAQFGFNKDSIIGPNAILALNMPIEQRMNQLYANMERLRWMPDSLEKTHVLINVADFTMDVFHANDTMLTMRTIVGTEYRETPVFNALITYIVFSPAWTIPPTIMRRDVIPAVSKDLKYLSDRNMKVFNTRGKVVDPESIDWENQGMNYTVLQSPGPHNALGKVKFMFPNKYNVYLHDTPTRGLFARDDRTFSSGCIRIEKPFEFATLLLRDMPEWTAERITQAMNAGNERSVVLKQPVGVYVYYLTAWAPGDNVVHYRTDVYGRDKPLLEALKKQLY